jgi:hypothetical protein
MDHRINVRRIYNLRTSTGRKYGKHGQCFASIKLLRDGVLEGYRDVMAGRTVEFEGCLRAALIKANG